MKKMSMGIGTNLISEKWAGIDVSTVRQLSTEILERANQKSQLAQVDLTAFKRAELGVDFYSSRTSIEAQRHISITNSNMQIETPISTNFLNAQAASSLYNPSSISKNVEGRIQPAISEGETENTIKEVFELSRNLEVYSADRDKRGSSNSNPFAHVKNEEENENDNKGNINFVA